MPKLLGIDVSADVLALNSHIEQAAKPDKTQARHILEDELRKRFVMQFEATWNLCGGPELEREFVFHPSRKWRADYRCGQWLIEIDGGVYNRGRHTRGAGFVEDCHKLNAAAMLGYRVIRIATGMANADYLRQIITVIANENSNGE